MVFVGCGKPSQGNSLDVPVDTATVLCSIQPGQPLSDDPAQTERTTIADGGPQWCDRALRIFFRDHPTLRIVDVLPVEYPVKEDSGFDAGTQELLVLHTSQGSWPLASTLEVIVWPCAAGPGSTGTACGSVIKRGHEVRPTPIWVPLAGRPDGAKSMHILQVAVRAH